MDVTVGLFDWTSLLLFDITPLSRLNIASDQSLPSLARLVVLNTPLPTAGSLRGYWTKVVKGREKDTKLWGCCLSTVRCGDALM